MEPREIPDAVRTQLGLQMVEDGMTKEKAAGLVDFKPTTFMHRIKGRVSKEEADHRKQLMTVEEERMLVDRCYLLGKMGFPPPVWRVRELALDILKKREPDATLGKKWVSTGFYHRHPEVRSVYSHRIEWIRTARGNNREILNRFFNEVCTYLNFSYYYNY